MKVDDIVFEEIETGKKMAKIGKKHYLFISVGHPWNECAAYLSDKTGKIINEEPAIFGICSSPEILALELEASNENR